MAISGVFGAGKTRSAAMLLAGLLVFDLNLKLMVGRRMESPILSHQEGAWIRESPKFVDGGL